MAKKETAQKTTAKKTASKAKAKPVLFSPDTVLTKWEAPIDETASGEKTSISHLNPLQIRYICSTLKHIVADIELITEVKRMNDQEYEAIVDGNISDALDNLIGYLKDNRVLKS